MKKLLIAGAVLATTTGANAADLGSIDAVRDALKGTYNSIQTNTWGNASLGYDEGAVALGVLSQGLADIGTIGQVSIEVQGGRFVLTADNFGAPSDADIDTYLASGVVDGVVNGVMNDVFGTEDLSGSNFIVDTNGTLGIHADAADGLISAEFGVGLGLVNTAVDELNNLSGGGSTIADVDAAIDAIQLTFAPTVAKANAVLDGISDAMDTFAAIDQNHYNNYRVDHYTLERDNGDGTSTTFHIIPVGAVNADGDELCYSSSTEGGAYEQYAKDIQVVCPTA